jgi:hypothetical protein
LEITDPIKSIGRIKKKKNGKVKSILHIFLFEVDSEVEPNLEDAQDGHEHTECGYFDVEEMEELEMEESLKKFIFKIFKDIFSLCFFICLCYNFNPNFVFTSST